MAAVTANRRSAAQQARRARERGMDVTEEKKDAQLGQPTRDDIRAAVMWTAQNTNRVPTLWGPTAVGKTWMIHDLAREHGATVISVLLSQHTPDEIMGFQMPGRDNQLVSQMPEWARQARNIVSDGGKAFILFDELNLAREEVRGAVYTFLRDRVIHGESFADPRYYVFAAMNPGILGAAYKSRCSFFHVPADRNYLLSIAGSNEFARQAILNAAITVEGEDSAYSNEGPPAPLTVDASAVAALMAARDSTDFWNMTPEARGLVISSLAPESAARSILGMSISMSGDDLVREPSVLFETIRSLPMPEALNIITSVVQTYSYTDKAVTAKAHAVILDAVYDSDPELMLAENWMFHMPEGVRDNLRYLDPKLVADALAEIGLVVEDAKGGPSGRLFDRLQQAVEYNLANPEKNG